MTPSDLQGAPVDTSAERTNRVSGFQSPIDGALESAHGPPGEAVAPAASPAQAKLLAQANAELDALVSDQLSHPLKVLFAQRDSALMALAAERTRLQQLEAERQLQVVAQAATLESAQTDHEGAHYAQEQDALQQLQLLQQELAALQVQLGAAQAEIDETREEAIRLQEERDEAIRATDDVRLEVSAELETAIRKTEDMQLQLDHVRRLWEDDQERSQAELDAVNARLADANAELEQARAALAESVAAHQVANLQAQNEALHRELHAARQGRSVQGVAAEPTAQAPQTTEAEAGLPDNPFAK